MYYSLVSSDESTVNHFLSVKCHSSVVCRLLSEYLRLNVIVSVALQAISVLSGLCWNLEGPTCFVCLSAIVNHLLRMPLNQERESKLYL